MLAIRTKGHPCIYRCQRETDYAWRFFRSFWDPLKILLKPCKRLSFEKLYNFIQSPYKATWILTKSSSNCIIKRNAEESIDYINIVEAVRG